MTPAFVSAGQSKCGGGRKHPRGVSARNETTFQQPRGSEPGRTSKRRRGKRPDCDINKAPKVARCGGKKPAEYRRIYLDGSTTNLQKVESDSDVEENDSASPLD